MSDSWRRDPSAFGALLPRGVFKKVFFVAWANDMGQDPSGTGFVEDEATFQDAFRWVGEELNFGVWTAAIFDFTMFGLRFMTSFDIRTHVLHCHTVPFLTKT